MCLIFIKKTSILCEKGAQLRSHNCSAHTDECCFLGYDAVKSRRSLHELKWNLLYLSPGRGNIISRLFSQYMYSNIFRLCHPLKLVVEQFNFLRRHCFSSFFPPCRSQTCWRRTGFQNV